MSSREDPITRITNATSIGTVKLSSLKRSNMAKMVGIVIARPPNAGVTPSCNAFSSLSKSLLFLFVPGLYVMSYFIAIWPIIGVKKRASKKPISNIGQN